MQREREHIHLLKHTKKFSQHLLVAEACKSSWQFHLLTFKGNKEQEVVQMDDFSLIVLLDFLKKCCRQRQKNGPERSVCTRVCVFPLYKRWSSKAQFNLYFQLKQFTFIFMHLNE